MGFANKEFEKNTSIQAKNQTIAPNQNTLFELSNKANASQLSSIAEEQRKEINHDNVNHPNVYSTPIIMKRSVLQKSPSPKQHKDEQRQQ